MNDIKLPSKIKVGGFWYEVCFPYNFDNMQLSDSGCLGMHEPATLKIKVRGLDSGGLPFPSSVIMESFLHEIFHAVDRIYCYDRIDALDSTVFARYEEGGKETAISALSIGWYQVLKDNSVLTLKTIPKKVKIGGFVYNIKYPYDIGGEDPTHIHGIEPNKNLIKLRDSHTHGIKYNSQIIRQFLLYFLTWAILDNYADFFDKDENIFMPFSYGLYQVLVDNKIEELIHKYK